MKMWKANGNTTTLLFSLKGLEILDQERVYISAIHRVIGMLLVSRFGLVEEDDVEVFHYYGLHFSSFLI